MKTRQANNTKEIADLILNETETTAHMLNNIEGLQWYLVGGLEISIRMNSIAGHTIRKHKNINIEIDEHMIDVLEKGMNENGYYLQKRITFNSFNPKDLIKRVRAKAPISSKHDMYLIKDTIQDNVALSDVINVKVCRRTDGGAIIYHNKKPIRIDEPYEGETVKIGNEQIKLRNISYIKKIKEAYPKAGDAFDIIFIERIKEGDNYKPHIFSSSPTYKKTVENLKKQKGKFFNIIY